jgi:sugar phosphate isomerase/epimerase
MKFGCSTMLYGGYDRETALDGLQAAGYEALELCSIPGMGDHLKGGLEDGAYREIRDRLQGAGLYLESVGGSGALGTDRFEPLMAAAGILGAPYLTLGTGGVADNADAWAQMIKLTRAALPVAESTGVRLSVKPHVRAAVYNTASALRFLEEVGSPLVGLNLDNTHLQRAGDDPAEAVAALRPWIFTARIRDFKSDDLGIGPIENQIPGKGMADVRGYLAALATVPGLEYVVVEMVGLKPLSLAEVQRIVGEALVALQSYQV